MTWIFGSFLVTPCALTSCHVVISKQGSTISVVGYNRCVTERRSRDENHAVRFGQSAENRIRARDTQPIRGVADQLARSCKHLQPPGSRKKIREEVLSLSICLYIFLSTNNKLWTLFENKARYIFLKRSVFRSFIIVDYVPRCS